MIYKLCETGIGDEELLEELSFDAPGSTEELSEESVAPVATLELIRQVREAYKDDDLVWRVMDIKNSG